MALITRQGLPAAITPAGISLVTTLPAPMMLSSPNTRSSVYVCGNPYAVADMHGFDITTLSMRFLGVKGVVGGVDAHARAEHNVVADRNLAHIEYDAPEIHENIIADGDVVAHFTDEIGF